MYKVLWFDDEHETLEDIKEGAIFNGIKMIGYSNSEEGLKALSDRYSRYDAVVLDGMFFNKESQSGTPDESAFGEVALALRDLKAKGEIVPWFVYSGQKNFVKDRTHLVELLTTQAYAHGKVFDKNNDEDFLELCIEIKKAADLQPLTKARHNNPKLMEIFELGYLPDVVERNVLDLLIKPLPSSNSELKDVLVNIRSIQESCLVKLFSIGVVHDSNDRFTNIIKHLSGNKIWNADKKQLIATTSEYQNFAIENLNKWIYHTCGTYIHYLEKEHFNDYLISNYAVESLRNGVFEILLWFKKTYQENV